MNFNQPQGLENNKIESIKTPENKVKEGVDFVFEQNPELAQVGSKEQYSEYLDTIFPESKVKDIVYHGTSHSFDEFRMWKNFFANDVKTAKNFAREKSFNTGDPEIIYSTLLNFKNPEIVDCKGKIWNADLENEILPFFKKSDGLIAINLLETYRTSPTEIMTTLIMKLKVLFGSYNKLPAQFISKPEQTWILGSQKDIENFKEFVSKNK